MRALGVPVEENGTEVLIRGRGPDSLRAPAADLDAGNSGSTIRMLSGILAAQPFTTRIGGDDSLSRRPMGRIIEPLLKATQLLLFGDVQVELEDVRAARDQFLLERVNLIVAG